ncbi:hypothetical protein VULLAG_LOCUS8580 [Vulpes lagopus]
MADFP